MPVGPAAKVTTAMEAMRLRKLFEFVGDHFGIAVEVIITDGRQPIGNGIGPVLEAQDVMAVLANEPAAPTDLREKSLRLAAHLLEYDPDLRGGSGYARAKELLDSGAALKQMHKIIEAQGPSDCSTELGTLTVDIPAPRDGVVEAIDCLRLNRLARTAGAPIDKGAGIRVFKKVGDWVEQGEPLYRIHAVDESEFDLALAGAKADAGYVVGNRTARRKRRVSDRSAVPAVIGRRRRGGWRRGLTCRCTRSRCIAFPTASCASRWVRRPRRPSSMPRSIGRTTSCWHCCSRRKPCVAAVRSGWCWWRPIFATCGRMWPFTRARRSARRSSAACWRARCDRVVTVDAHLHRTAHIEEVFPGIAADDLSAMPAMAETLRASGVDPRTVVVGPDEESRPWVSDLAGRLGARACGGAQDAPRRPLGRNRSLPIRRCSPAGRRC